MGISLTKGANVNLTRTTPGLRNITVGLGWDVRTSVGDAFDLDASVFMLTEAGSSRWQVRSPNDLIFFNNTRSACGAVEYGGDNRTGDAAGDDETVRIDLSRMPADIVKVAVAATIYDGEARRQNFGMVSSAYVRLVNDADGAELARFDLSEDASTESAMVFGEVYLHNGEWKFRAVGQGYQGGLAGLCREYGVKVG
jgi:tellurium resistance protein TerD